jgi:hypothetical protein
VLDERFLPYCKDNGIDLLREDIIFLRIILAKCPTGAHDVILNGYLKKWRLGEAKAINDIQRSSSGRREANTWIRERYGKNSFRAE